MSENRILLIDDEREMTRMMRTALQSFDQSLIIDEVLSGEEGLLELERHAYDLVVTDLNLPGVNGLDLVARLRETAPNTQLIIMTGDTSTETQRLVGEYNPLGYFIKPVDMVVLLDMVQLTFFRKMRQRSEAQANGFLADIQDNRTIADRLTQLRRDLGALTVVLVDQDGEIVVRAGDVSALGLEKMLGNIEASFNAGIKVSQALGASTARNMQFIDGADFDIYVLNVGQYYMLLVGFDSRFGANQMGPVMRYGRQCADDLLSTMADVGVAQAKPQIEAAVKKKAKTGPLDPVMIEAVEAQRAAEAEQTAAPVPVPEAAAEQPATEPAPAPKPEPQPEPAPAPEPEPEPELQGINLDDLLQGAEEIVTTEADRFWERAVSSEADNDGDANSLSFEQAQRLGLFGEDG